MDVCKLPKPFDPICCVEMDIDDRLVVNEFLFAVDFFANG